MEEKMFELLLRIKEAVGEEVFKDALALIQPTTPPHPGAGVAEREERTGRLKLPWTFICEHGHKHAVVDVAQLLSNESPRCLFKRVLVELLV